MEVSEVNQMANLLQVKFIVTNYNIPNSRMSSPEYIINNVAIFQVQVRVFQVKNEHTNDYYNLIFVKFKKTRPCDDLTYTIKLTSKELLLWDKMLYADEGSYRCISEFKKQQYTLDINVEMEVSLPINSFASLGDDEEFTDITICGNSGSVSFHKVILATASPYLRRLLHGSWRANNYVHVPTASKKTLQDLKKYVYCKIIPDNGLQELLLLAQHFEMPALEQKCVYKLINTNNVSDNVDFAFKHKVKRLLLALGIYL